MTAEVMRKEKKNRGGAPKGNQNARKHGFYSKVLTQAQMMDFCLAADVDGIEDEIRLLRVKIKSLLVNEPDNFRLIIQATETLARMVKIAYKLDRQSKNRLLESIRGVIRDAAVPLGLGLGAIIKK